MVQSIWRFKKIKGATRRLLPTYPEAATGNPKQDCHFEKQTPKTRGQPARRTALANYLQVNTLQAISCQGIRSAVLIP
jgi:hypothetical protein